MSTNTQRLESAIQSIAEQSPRLRSLLKANENKGGKAASAGVGVSEAEETRICCDGSTSDNANPGAEERDPTDGDQAGLNADDPADLSALDGGCLTGVTNCDTGEEICFCGDDFIPPDGWEDGAPTLEGWFDGYYWVRNNYPYKELTCCQVYEAIYADDARYIFSNCSPDNSSGAPVTFTLTSTSDGSSFQSTDSCHKKDCGVEYVDSVCDLDEPPIEDTWPADSCVNISIKNGYIVGSKYDPENDGSYSAPMDEMHLCDGANSMYLAPSGSEPGGYKTINSTREAGYLYNSRNEKIAHIDGNEYSDPTM